MSDGVYDGINAVGFIEYVKQLAEYNTGKARIYLYSEVWTYIRDYITKHCDRFTNTKYECAGLIIDIHYPPYIVYGNERVDIMLRSIMNEV